jgi:exodeoxyribonuclease III
LRLQNLRAKIPYWEALIATLSSQSANRALAIGDFTTCRAYLDEARAIDATAHYIDAIEQIGFCDLWRHRYPNRREYSWFSTRNNGFRIDHAFLSQELEALAGTVHYSHEERLAGLSDHSPLILGPCRLSRGNTAIFRPANWIKDPAKSDPPGRDLSFGTA